MDSWRSGGYNPTMSFAAPRPAASLPRRAEPSLDDVDQRVFLHNVPWAQYEDLLAVRGDRSVPRLTYLDGTLELMSPAIDHEGLKTRFARLLEAWSEEIGIDLDGFGSWTLRKEGKKGGLEPDECYVVRPAPGLRPERPDIALEVIWTSGGLDKLEIYRRLEVREVWIWEDEALAFYVLEGDAYVRRERSALLPELDPKLLLGFMNAELSQAEAVRGLRRAMRGR